MSFLHVTLVADFPHFTLTPLVRIESDDDGEECQPFYVIFLFLFFETGNF